MTTLINTCCARIGFSFHDHACGKKAKYIRDGRHYCGTHDPVAVAAKEKARNDKWALDIANRSAARSALRKAADEQARRAECYPDLLAALIRVRNQDRHGGHFVELQEMVAAAIQKATGAPA